MAKKKTCHTLEESTIDSLVFISAKRSIAANQSIGKSKVIDQLVAAEREKMAKDE